MLRNRPHQHPYQKIEVNLLMMKFLKNIHLFYVGLVILEGYIFYWVESLTVWEIPFFFVLFRCSPSLTVGEETEGERVKSNSSFDANPLQLMLKLNKIINR
ncbi:hypothetical protein IM40_02710 [Candidatus Paracaedimonas acanthamoebae]|nr:hypothetical protein IM40_02710 [Candidatus Paracaedimonas acanthamoebae]